MFVHAAGAGAISTTTAGDIFETAPAFPPSTLFTSATLPPPTPTGAFARSGCRNALAWERSVRKGNFAGAAAFANSESTPGGDPPFTVADGDADTADAADGG